MGVMLSDLVGDFDAFIDKYIDSIVFSAYIAVTGKFPPYRVNKKKRHKGYRYCEKEYFKR